MNIDKNLWNTTEAIESGEFKTLSLGGHKLVIKKAEPYTSPVSQNTSLKIEVDIAKGDDFEGYFQKQFDDNNNADKKWNNGGTKYLSLKADQMGYLKGFITALEKSNASFKFNLDGEWKQLEGLVIAGVFGWEEYTKQDGSVGLATKLTQFRSIDKLSEIKIPRVKTLQGDYVDYDLYVANRESNQVNSMNTVPKVTVNPSDLPFIEI